MTIETTAGAAADSAAERHLARAEENRRRAENQEKLADNYLKGALGERLVATELTNLEPIGYRAIHDLALPGTARANVDHLVYGPTGMYVVDTKNWAGDVRVTRGILRSSGYRKVWETEAVAEMATVLEEHLGASVGRLTPVLCLVQQTGLEAELCGTTVVTSLDRFTPWICRQPVIWPASHVDALAAWLPSMVQPATAPRPAPPEKRGRHQAD